MSQSVEAPTIKAQYSHVKFNQNHGYLQDFIDDLVSDYCQQVTTYIDNKQMTMPRFGMLSEIASRTPVIVFDAPEICINLQTAATDGNRIYFNAYFLEKMLKEQASIDKFDLNSITISEPTIKKMFESAIANRSLLNVVEFVQSHELEHVRRLHLQRMLDIDHDLANQAQDIRINLDVISLAVHEWLLAGNLANMTGFINSKRAYETQIIETYLDILNRICPTIAKACGTKPDDVRKYHRKTEEEIAAMLAANPKQQQPKQNPLSIDFGELCKAVSQDLDDIGLNGVPQAVVLSKQVDDLGKKRGNIPAADKRVIMNDLFVISMSKEMEDRDAKHDGLIASGGASVSVTDPEVAKMRPSERADMLIRILDMLLNPSTGNQSSKGGTTINGLDGLTNGNGQGQKTLPNKPDNHTITPEELAQKLKDANLNNVIEKLGYDDLEKIERTNEQSKDLTNEAITRSAENLKACSNVYPGAHMTEYAVEKRNDFYKPALHWKVETMKLMMAGAAKMTRDELEPTSQTIAIMNNPEEFGFGHDEVGWESSYVPAQRTEKPFIAIIEDTSGSVPDDMLMRFTTEAIGMARETEGQTSPDVAICFADTVCRGDPVFVTEENMDEIFKDGVYIGGRGGTNLTAAIQNVFSWTQKGKHFEGRDVSAVVYFTDTLDAAPKLDAIMSHLPEHMDELPPILFLAPIECYNAEFEKGVSEYAKCVFFDLKQLNEIDLTEKKGITRGMKH